VVEVLAVEAFWLVPGLLWILPNLFWLGYFVIVGGVVRFRDVSVKRLNLVASVSRLIFIPLSLLTMPVLTALIVGFSFSLWLGVFGLLFGLLVVAYGDYSLIRIKTKVRDVLGGGQLSPKSLVTDGPYGVVRHPMYSALLFVTLGLTVALPLYYNVVNLVLASVCIFLYTVIIEEPLTLKIFGQEYVNYMKKVPRRFLTRKRTLLCVGCAAVILANYTPWLAAL
jgi:protein-S-isoprenylcysteine O-methyltransferase Ste14